MIQVQKGKVELEGTMLVLEKLVKSNELNFGLLAVVPLIWVIYWSITSVNQGFSKLVNQEHVGNVKRLKECIHMIDFKLSREFKEPADIGEFLLDCAEVLEIVEADEEIDYRLAEEIIEMARPNSSEQQKHWILERVYRLLQE